MASGSAKVPGKAAGLSDEQMVALRAGRVDFDPKLAALLDLAREYAGWTDAELTELAVHATLNLFTNYFNHYVRTDLDLPAAPPCEPHPL